MLLVPDLSKVASNLEQHLLVHRDLARAFLPDTLEKICDRRVQRAGDLEQSARGDAVDPPLIFVRLLIADANHRGKLILSQAKHDPPFLRLVRTSSEGPPLFPDRRELFLREPP